MSFGFLLYSAYQKDGLAIRFDPAFNQIKVGEVLAPLDMSAWRDGKPANVRIFVDKFLVEVFVDDKQAVVDSVGKIWKNRSFSFLSEAQLARGMKPAVLKTLNIWRLKHTNQSFFDALQNRVWDPEPK